MTTDSTAGNEQPEMQRFAGATHDWRVKVVTTQAMAVEGPPREEAATDEEVRAAARQFVRKISGYREPSRRNAEAFEAAVDEIARSSRQLLDSVAQPA